MHVHTAVFVVSIILLVCAVADIVYKFLAPKINWWSVGPTAILMLIVVMLLVGNRMNKVCLYCPFLIFNIIRIILALAMVVLMIVVFILNWDDLQEEEHGVQIFLLSVIILETLLIVAIQLYLHSLVTRDRNFLLNQPAKEWQKSTWYRILSFIGKYRCYSEYCVYCVILNKFSL
ncbi:unnamed protein product [Bursaphelenchus okinawaensis]|uniref:Uncharacterized protein n=1 Tax=Bursaphelenchus okinawaensis TaxID=465554 RepID=A0A811KLB7_9BILA|nr:unnamed protein product [Bursaphelenchus okinawaensis]CAG9105617.1 unnamed protein product [Bursaphelenchus okinawaensis]